MDSWHHCDVFLEGAGRLVDTWFHPNQAEVGYYLTSLALIIDDLANNTSTINDKYEPKKVYNGKTWLMPPTDYRDQQNATNYWMMSSLFVPRRNSPLFYILHLGKIGDVLHHTPSPLAFDICTVFHVWIG